MKSVQGMASLSRKLKDLPGEYRAEIDKALDKSADDMVRTSSALAPEDSGALRKSIIKKPLSSGHAVEISAGGDEAYYAVIVEKKRPFFNPAYRLMKKRMLSRIKRATNKAAKGISGG